MTEAQMEVSRGSPRPPSTFIHVWRALEIREGLNWRWHAVVFLAALIAIFSRLPGALLHPQFFAEDGWVWYQQAYNLGWLRTFGITQAGYLQTLPRLAAGLALLFPMQWAPFIMNLAGAVVQVMPVTALLSRRCAPWGPLPVRMLMAVLYIVIPNAPEIHIVMTNAMWHLAVLQVLLAFSVPPLSWRGRVLDILLFGIGSVSGPFCMLLLPLVAVYYWVRRQSWTLVILGLLSAGVLLQIFYLAHSVRSASAQPLGVTALSLLRIVAGNIFVNSMTGSGGAYLPLWLLISAAIGGFAILTCAWGSCPLALRLYIAFTVFALAASLRDPLITGSTTRWEELADVAGIRYWFLPSLMFLWVAAWCVWGGKNVLLRYAGAAVLLLTTIGIARKWSYPPFLPETHFSADVERFKDLKTGEHMRFAVYDPWGRKMELIKH
jgi:hypothetical protein